jgi:hypothetical protein
MIICDRCGWLIPTDCTCRRQLDQLSVLRLKHDVADRHRQSVARAHRSGWPVRIALIEPEGRAARTAHVPATFQPPDKAKGGAIETGSAIRRMATMTRAFPLRGGTPESGASGSARAGGRRRLCLGDQHQESRGPGHEATCGLSGEHERRREGS